MSKYKEANIVGESWVRSNRITCTNEYGKNPQIHFQEEELFSSSDGKVVRSQYIPTFPKIESFNNSNTNTEFGLIDPSTETFTGNTSTYKSLYVLLHSLYFHLTKKQKYNNRTFIPMID